MSKLLPLRVVEIPTTFVPILADAVLDAIRDTADQDFGLNTLDLDWYQDAVRLYNKLTGEYPGDDATKSGQIMESLALLGLRIWVSPNGISVVEHTNATK